jgi:hypothetical protein
MTLKEFRMDTAYVIENFLIRGSEPKIHSESSEYLEMCEAYVMLAESMPYQEVLRDLREYDNSHPKMDEIKFVRDLQSKYNQTEENVLTRIRFVRKLSKINWIGNNI